MDADTTTEPAAVVDPATDLRAGDTLVWTQIDGALVFVRVVRVSHDRGVVWLRCSWGGRSWTRRHELPLFPSMVRRPWTTAELLETIT